MTAARRAAPWAALMTLLLIWSLFWPPAVYVCLAAGVCGLSLLKPAAQFALLLYLMPYAVMFKPASGTTSFFTVLELWALALLLLRIRSIDRRVLAALLVLLMELALTSCLSLSLVKVLCNLLIAYTFVRNYRCEDACAYGCSFVSGLLVSSALGLCKERIPRFLSMYSDLNYETINGVRTLRFSGTFNDPNYYAVALILAILLCGAALRTPGKGRRGLCALALMALIGCGAATYSKSFALMLLFALFVLLRGSERSRWISAGVCAAVCAVVFVLNPGDMVSRMLARFSSGSFTTGREEIWRYYWNGITDAFLPFLFGHGLDAQLARPAHSLVLEALYAIGLLGTVCWARALMLILRSGTPPVRPFSYAGYAAIFLMYGFLTGLTGYELPFELMMAYVFSRVGEESLPV